MAHRRRPTRIRTLGILRTDNLGLALLPLLQHLLLLRLSTKGPQNLCNQILLILILLSPFCCCCCCCSSSSSFCSSDSSCSISSKFYFPHVCRQGLAAQHIFVSNSPTLRRIFTTTTLSEQNYTLSRTTLSGAELHFEQNYTLSRTAPQIQISKISKCKNTTMNEENAMVVICQYFSLATKRADLSNSNSLTPLPAAMEC